MDKEKQIEEMAKDICKLSKMPLPIISEYLINMGYCKINKNEIVISKEEYEIKQEVLQGLNCCVEFLCGECPYKKYDSVDYPFRCVNKLMKDLKEQIIDKKGV